MKKKTIGYKGKSGVGTLNATQETPSLYKIWFLNKSKRTFKKLPFWAVLVKIGIFWGFSWFFQKPRFVWSWGFFVLHSVPQDASFELSKKGFRQFFRFFIIRGDPFDLGGFKISLSRFIVVLQSNLKMFCD